MEGILFEIFEVGFGVAFTALSLLGIALGGVLLAGMGEAERAGARLTWAEWPIHEAAEIAAPAAVRLAA